MEQCLHKLYSEVNVKLVDIRNGKDTHIKLRHGTRSESDVFYARKVEECMEVNEGEPAASTGTTEATEQQVNHVNQGDYRLLKTEHSYSNSFTEAEGGDENEIECEEFVLMKQENKSVEVYGKHSVGRGIGHKCRDQLNENHPEKCPLGDFGDAQTEIERQYEDTPGPDDGSNPRNSVMQESRADGHNNQEVHKCLNCFRTFADKYILSHHSKSHKRGRKQYKCSECYQQFSSRGSLFVHNAMHTAEKKHACRVCCKRFKQKEDMQAHLHTHRQDRKRRKKEMTKGEKLKKRQEEKEEKGGQDRERREQEDKGGQDRERREQEDKGRQDRERREQEDKGGQDRERREQEDKGRQDRERREQEEEGGQDREERREQEEEQSDIPAGVNTEAPSQASETRDKTELLEHLQTKACQQALCGARWPLLDEHSFCIAHDVCIWSDLFDPEACGVCSKLIQVCLKALSIRDLESLPEYGQFKYRWIKSHKYFKIIKNSELNWKNGILRAKFPFALSSGECLASPCAATPRSGSSDMEHTDFHQMSDDTTESKNSSISVCHLSQKSDLNNSTSQGSENSSIPVSHKSRKSAFNDSIPQRSENSSIPVGYQSQKSALDNSIPQYPQVVIDAEGKEIKYVIVPTTPLPTMSPTPPQSQSPTSAPISIIPYSQIKEAVAESVLVSLGFGNQDIYKHPLPDQCSSVESPVKKFKCGPPGGEWFDNICRLQVPTPTQVPVDVQLLTEWQVPPDNWHVFRYRNELLVADSDKNVVEEFEARKEADGGYLIRKTPLTAASSCDIDTFRESFYAACESAASLIPQTHNLQCKLVKAAEGYHSVCVLVNQSLSIPVDYLPLDIDTWWPKCLQGTSLHRNSPFVNKDWHKFSYMKCEFQSPKVPVGFADYLRAPKLDNSQLLWSNCLSPVPQYLLEDEFQFRTMAADSFSSMCMAGKVADILADFTRLAIEKPEERLGDHSQLLTDLTAMVKSIVHASVNPFCSSLLDAIKTKAQIRLTSAVTGTNFKQREYIMLTNSSPVCPSIYSESSMSKFMVSFVPPVFVLKKCNGSQIGRVSPTSNSKSQFKHGSIVPLQDHTIPPRLPLQA